MKSNKEKEKGKMAKYKDEKQEGRCGRLRWK